MRAGEKKTKEIRIIAKISEELGETLCNCVLKKKYLP